MPDLSGGINKLSTLDGLFKRVWAPALENLVPSWAIMQADVDFSESSRTGEDYMQPVVLQMEHGITRAASGDGAFTLNIPISGQIKKAVVTGYQHVLRSAIDYETAFSGSGGERAFKGATATTIESMTTTIHKELELDILYGQDTAGLGVASAISTTTNSNDTITFTDASWAPGIWAGQEGATFDVFATAMASKRTGAGTAGTLSKVDLDNKKIVFSASITGSPVAGDIVQPINVATAGSPPTSWKQMAGFTKILGNTGTLFNVDAGAYSLWKGITHDAGSTDLSYGTVLDAVAKIVAKGADSDLNCYISPITWANLMNDQAALRRYDSSATTSKVVLGAKQIEFWGQLGKITVKPHPMIKAGIALGISTKLWQRIGATDVTFTRPPGSAGGQFFRELIDQAGFELRCYSHQALFSRAPGKAFLINNIVNS